MSTVFVSHRYERTLAGWNLQRACIPAAGVVEIDDAYFGSSDDKGHPQYLKMQVVNDLKKTIAEFANTNVQTGSTISSDTYRSYNHLKKQGFQLESKAFNPKEDEEQLKMAAHNTVQCQGLCCWDFPWS